MKEIPIPSFSKCFQSCSRSTVVFMKVVRLVFTREVEFDCQIDFIYFETIHFYPSNIPNNHSIANIPNVVITVFITSVNVIYCLLILVTVLLFLLTY